MKHASSLALLALLLSACCLSCSQLNTRPEPADRRQPSYLALETYSGRILYTGNPNERRPIGMLANIATALVILDWVDSRGITMDRILTVPAEACRLSETNLLHLQPGDTISLRDALHVAVMTDDCACADTLAHACGSTINPNDPAGAFVSQMNQMGKAIGMTATLFKGTSGATVTQSDAHDLAKLGMYAIEKPALSTICSKSAYTVTVNNSNRTTVYNTNRMLSDASVNGIRAARSDLAGACLLLSAKRASVKRYSLTSQKEETYPQQLLIIILGAHSSETRYQVASLLLRDSWLKWDEWQKTGDYTDKTKFITVPRKSATPAP